jgi:2-succinyl-5-enolpyruvyl-6-hydroxy-3-cyclohexene-1-carboxylate synthase
LVIGNSLPVRDLDSFVSRSGKNLFLHFNRGASGIDGVTSTALGIASRKKQTILITGDLSFLHDLNALSIGTKYSLPLSIVIINNNGGGIFESLPIAKRFNKLNEYFVAPHNLNLGDIVNSFGIKYKLVKSKRDLKHQLSINISKNSPSVLEIQTDAVKSVEMRKKISEETKKILDEEFEQ